VIQAAHPGAGSLVWSRRRLLALFSMTAFIRPAKAESAIVEMHQLKFAPAEIEIAVGGTVTFVNLDLVPHTATGDAFDTGTLRNGERKEIAFPVAGAFPYLCKFHRHMTGRVVVR
jgi:plastocyanin